MDDMTRASGMLPETEGDGIVAPTAPEAIAEGQEANTEEAILTAEAEEEADVSSSAEAQDTTDTKAALGAEATPPPPAVDYAAMEAEDLLSLKEEFPELRELTSLRQLEQPARYGALRDLGLSAKEAYLATEHHRRILPDNRAHLRSAVPRNVHGTGDGISPAELSAARELFGGLSDHEIRKLYKRVSV